MPSLTFVSPQGVRREIAVSGNSSAMNAARLNGIGGIEAECGGALSCGTCHVYVDEADIEKLPPPSDEEGDMLDLVAAPRRATSRLCCQIELSDEIDSLTLHIPETQF